MNILHLQPHLNISCGVTKSIFLLAKYCNSSITHFVLTFTNNAQSRFDKLNIQPIILKEFFLPFRLFFNLLTLYKICKKYKIDILHSHHRYFDLLAFFVSKFINVRTITTVHSKVTGRRWLSYKSDKIIAVAENIRKHLIHTFPINGNNIKVIYNFIDPEEFNTKSGTHNLKSEMGLPEDSFVIGFIGRIDFEEKGIDILLKAFKNVSMKREDSYLLLIGEGKDYEKTKQQIESGNLKAILINEVTDIKSFYDLIDLFVLPSRIDPFPMVMLEAGLMKRPFVGSNVDGIRELIDDMRNGLLFKSNNQVDLESKMIKSIDDKSLILRLGENLHIDVCKNFNAKVLNRKYEDIYRNLMR